MRYYVTWAGRERAVELKPVGDALVAIVDGVEHPVDVASTEEGGLLNLIVGGASYTYGCRFEDGHAVLSFHDREVRVQIEDDRERQTRLLTGGGRGGATGAKVKSSMPGVVKELRVAAGDTVAAGAPLLILEAMKMEHTIAAPSDGVLKAHRFAVGDQVSDGAELVEFEPAKA